MELLSGLAGGFDLALSPLNLLYCFIGVALGTAIGVLPGIGPTATIAMLLPVTFGLDPIAAMILLSGIYYGSQYGGSTTAILVKIPGEASSVVTCLDGYQMALRGRAGPALAIAAIGSFAAGCVGTLVIALFAPPLAAVALQFGPAAYVSLMLVGLLAAVVLASGSVVKAVAMVILGLMLGLIGTDVNTGQFRFTFGIPELYDGIDFVVLAMGVFGIGEVISNVAHSEFARPMKVKIASLMPTREDLRASWKPILRGSGLGAALGILPGGGALLPSFASYALEKKLARHPERFGEGAIEGVAGPESANNAGAQTSFIPMLTLGIPGNSVMALMIGALMIHGIQPGPQVLSSQPELFWALIASMWVGNLLLLVLNLPLIGIWVTLLSSPYRLLFPTILFFCCVGVFSIANSTFDIVLAAMFGVLGYVFAKLRCEAAPMILGFVLGPLIEENLRRAMLLSRGDATVFVTDPISLAALIFGLLLLGSMVLRGFRSARSRMVEADS